MSELPKSNLTLEQYIKISDTVKKVYGDVALTYTDYGDLIYVYFTKIDFHDDDSTVINNDKVIYIGKTFEQVIERLRKTLRNKKLKRIIEDE